jgi:hypothetical protein
MKDIRAQWKAHAALRKITKEDIAALCIYRAMVKEEIPDGAKSRLHKSFQPITNQVKLDNGADPWYSMKLAVNSVKYSVFKEWLDEDELKSLVEAAKSTRTAIIK